MRRARLSVRAPHVAPDESLAVSSRPAGKGIGPDPAFFQASNPGPNTGQLRKCRIRRAGARAKRRSNTAPRYRTSDTATTRNSRNSLRIIAASKSSNPCAASTKALSPRIT